MDPVIVEHEQERMATWSADGVNVTGPEAVIEPIASYYEYRSALYRRQIRRVRSLLALIRSGRLGRNYTMDEIEQRLADALDV